MEKGGINVMFAAPRQEPSIVPGLSGITFTQGTPVDTTHTLDFGFVVVYFKLWLNTQIARHYRNDLSIESW